MQIHNLLPIQSSSNIFYVWENTWGRYGIVTYISVAKFSSQPVSFFWCLALSEILEYESTHNLWLNPLTPISDQDRISPYNIDTISSSQVMRMIKNINQEISMWFNTKFSRIRRWDFGSKRVETVLWAEII